MESNQNESTFGAFWRRQAITIKGVIIFFLCLILMIPTSMVADLIREREGRQAETVAEVSSKWGGTQTITGPVLAVPCTKELRNEKGKIESVSTFSAYFLPSALTVNGEMIPQKLNRGIFEVVLYTGKLQMEGTFERPVLKDLLEEGVTVEWNKASLLMGIPDLRGLQEQVVYQWNGMEGVFDPGMPNTEIAASGVNAPVSINPETNQYAFKVGLTLKGSGALYFTPLGKVTEVQLKSSWPDPSFTGAFLPVSKEINAQGFDAQWKVLNLNRNYPQSWTSPTQYDFGQSAFGVDLLLPVDNYQKSTRSVKYAILFIALTFLAVFFIEMRHANPVHPFQYALIGLALVIFYTLLVSISEHLSFNMAYLISALMTILLTAWYTRALFQSAKMGMLVAGTMTALYGFLFVTLQLQDYALLIGSLGLFVILAVVMQASRQIRWNKD